LILHYGYTVPEIKEFPLYWHFYQKYIYVKMAEERLHKIALKLMPKQKRAGGRPKKNWMEGIKKAIKERNLNEGQWEDRKQWILGVGQCRKMF
jgi:hypothetical protein